MSHAQGNAASVVPTAYGTSTNKHRGPRRLNSVAMALTPTRATNTGIKTNPMTTDRTRTRLADLFDIVCLKG